MDINIYRANKISDKVIVVGEVLSEYVINVMTLVIGESKAALIDTGMGITGDLDRYIRQFTNLPIMVLSTHADPDHVGSNLLFDDIYMSILDDDLLPWALSHKTRLDDLVVMSNGNKEICRYARTHIVSENQFAYKNIEDGDIFDLGGTMLEAVAVPGHTKGSMCFVNRTDRYAITGDTITTTPWIWLERCTTMSQYIDSVKRFKARAEGIIRVYSGHSLEPLSVNIIDDIITAGEEIMEGKTGNDMPYIVPYNIDTSEMKVMRHNYGNAHIIYNAYKY